ncbi:MAG TPA: methyltransferase [Croceibacterium sp.]|nr:methyltransferase [Croceibacterium sp.]
MRRIARLVAIAGLTVAGTAALAQAQVPQSVAAAVADSGRPEADRARDAARKPAEIVAFAGVRPGDKVAEFLPGGGYYTRILSKTVGPQGHVYVLVPAGFAQRPGGLDALNTLATELGNVTVVAADLTNFTLPEPVDLAWTSENYHDMHNGPTPSFAGINEATFRALKPGGIYFIEDHAAVAGTGTTVTSTLHRIDPAAVIEELMAAGFTLDAQSDVLANPADPKTAGVRDPSIQGETEKFAMRFRKNG